jgi:ribA/ribD-fused uncharacterized protein
MNEDCYFFWRGKLSQWAKSKFTVGGVTYSCAEQYMMHQKAMMFNDLETAEKILECDSPKEQQALGRIVKNYDQALWDERKEDIVYSGNIAKFSQNSDLLKLLNDTGDKLLVEASPIDKIWGIGLDEDDAAKTPKEKWRGQNLLGKCLTKVRNDLK